MLCFDVTQLGVFEGLRLHTEPYPHVALGEEGRGRELVRFPVGRAFADKLAQAGEERVLRGSVIATREKGTLLLVEERPGDTERALVALRIPAGFRGHTTIEPTDGVVKLAAGRCAQGDAGRMGGHEEALLIMPPGARVTVRRFGRLYGAPAVLVVSWDGCTLRMGAPDELDPPSDEAPEGELV
jgi:hypothetical protein